MPQKGHSQSEETKKKISEALKKDGVEIVKRSPKAKKLFDKYMSSKSRTSEMRIAFGALLAKRKALGNKKATKAARAKITEQLKGIREKMKQEVLARRELVAQAKAERRMKQAKMMIAKAKLRTQKLKGVEQKAKERLQKAKTPEAKQKLQEYLKRIADLFKKQDSIVNEAKGIISDKGQKALNKGKGTFDFDEFDHDLDLLLSERQYSPYRALTVQEERADLEFLNEKFNQLEGGLEEAYLEETQAQIDALTAKAEKSVKEGDMKAVEALIFGGYLLFRNSVNDTAKQAYQIGKSSASKEMKVPEPPTDKNNTQIRNAEAEQIADMYVTEMGNEAKSVVRNAILAGATANVAAVAVRSSLNKRASEMISGISGTVPGMYLNRGRKQVFFANLNKITHFQRSEVLDIRTCNMCLSLDKRIVKADDPFSHMETIHTYCRGTWVPIFTSEEQPKDSAVGVPKTIRDSFESIDGRPVVNDFKQLKKPMNTKENPEAKAEIEKRLNKKK